MSTLITVESLNIERFPRLIFIEAVLFSEDPIFYFVFLTNVI